MVGTNIRIEDNAKEILDVFTRPLATEANQQSLWSDVGEYLHLPRRFRFDLAITSDGDPW